ncbi:MAG: aldose 1-epimerase, partial [Pseudomonadales bacterium]|nr:aldose 1-epimerase [Pseudomonadales bacterium]
MIELTRHRQRLRLAPEQGGVVVSWCHEGRELLRPAPARLDDPRDAAGFPLVPFSGRIALGRFRLQGMDVALPPNMPPEPHAIHGQGWQNAWHLGHRGDDQATLVFDHRAGAWPWAYRATQHFVLTGTGLELRLSLHNRGATAMPAGLGWHPYFPRAGARLRADVLGIWKSGDDMVPAPPRAPTSQEDLRQERRVDDLELDDCFDAGSEGVHLRWPDHGLTLAMTASETLRKLIV